MKKKTTTDSNLLFTFFGKGHWSEKSQKYVPSTTPQQTVDIGWCAQYITSERPKWNTQELRRLMTDISDESPKGLEQHAQMLRDFKLKEFDAVAPSGIFSYGNAKGIVKRSRFICLDIDDLASTDEARWVQQTLIADREVVTALCFVSPKGLGVKWWVELPAWCLGKPFAEQYAALSRYIGFEYGLQADPSCSNVNRLCFLPYDPKCYVNPKYAKS